MPFLTTASRFILPYWTVVDGAGVPLPGAQLYFFVSGTSTPLPTFQDQNLTVPNTNPVIAAANGLFGNIFMQQMAYKVRLEDADGDEIWTSDPVTPAGTPYDIAINFPGVPAASLTFRYTASRPLSFAANFSSIAGGTSQSTSQIAATASATFAIQRAIAASPDSFSQIGTLNYVASAVTGLFASTAGLAYSLATGDVLQIVCPASPDATLAGISITISAQR